MMASAEFGKKLRALQQKKRIGVYRITVDDVLTEDLIRFEFCTLKDNVKEFGYELTVWSKPYEVLASGDTFEQELGIPFSWDTLEPGQVFLFGEFDLVGYKDKPELFRLKTGDKRLVRIDKFPGHKDQVRRAYSELLQRRV